ncbi:hypothetical protein sos41_19900 [Alphaproteobacteria bacterium SO-S41]|nr:hypothetical protein sos41_19900 [Alphaproteobacteria bacterium SO-S41]
MTDTALRETEGMTVILYRGAGGAALLAGVLRIASAFIPYAPDQAALETVFGLVDLGLLFGTIGIYLADRDALGLAGLAGFVVLLSGIASIVGPDSVFLGVNTYAVGVNVIAAGAVILAVQWLRTGRLTTSALTLISSVAIGGIGPVAGLGGASFVAAGVLFGIAYAAAGLHLLRRF